MPYIRAMVVIPRHTAIPADAVSNTWHFFAGHTVTGTDADLVAARVLTFYEDDTLGQSVGSFMGPMLNGAGTVFKIYDLSDPEPRSPILEVNLEITIPTGGSAVPPPSESAVAMSYQAVQESGIPQARRRGRIYLGPFSDLAAERVSNISRPKQVLRDTIQSSAEVLQATNDSGLYWTVYSTAGAGPPAVGPEVTNGWIDDAWDTQRRRGELATERTLWSA